MAEPPPEPGDTPEAGNAPNQGTKRSQSNLDTTAPDPNIKEEPDAKKPKLEAVAAAAEQPLLNTIDIDPAGDLLIAFGDTSYKVDSAAIKRAARKLYEQCLAARGAGNSSWTFKTPWRRKFELKGVEYVLHAIHANLEQVPESMACIDVRNAVIFATHYEFLGRFLGLFKQWYRALGPLAHCCSSDKEKGCKCGRLWTTYHLGLEEEFNTLQGWAIFNLCDNGNGSLGDPSEQRNGKSLELSDFVLAETVVTDRLIRLRSEAVDLIVKNLKETQLALIPSGQFGSDGRIKNKFGGRACAKCLDLWLGCLSRSLLRPVSSVVWSDFPALSVMTDAKDYRQPLAKLCTFVGVVQGKMNGYFACTVQGYCACTPPQLVGRKAVEDLINRGLQAPLSAT